MMTYYLRNEKGFPEACIALEGDERGYIYAVAAWNSVADKDNYARERSRAIAIGRLKAGTIVKRNGTLVGGELDPGPRVLRRALQAIINNSHFAQRVRNNAKLALARLKAKDAPPAQ